MNTRNKEDIPTRNFKKKKKQQEHHNWRQTTFHMEQNKKTKKKNEEQQQQQQPAKHWKIFKFSRGTNFWQTKLDVKYQSTWNFFQQNIIFQHFLLPNLQNKVTFFKLSLTLLLFRFLSSHGLSLPLPHWYTNTTARNSREPQKTHTTPLKYTATSVSHLLGS